MELSRRLKDTSIVGWLLGSLLLQPPSRIHLLKYDPKELCKFSFYYRLGSAQEVFGEPLLWLRM